MNRKLSYLLRLILVSVFVLSGCGPVTPAPINVEPTKEPPSIQAQPAQVGPYLVAQDPPAGQRLELLPSLEFTFDRDMDQTKTADAFTLLDANDKSISGRKLWLDAKTFSFKPSSKLEPSSMYKAIFSTSAADGGGQALQEEIRLELTTIDLLAVGQVFPVDRTEDIDPATNITVIFNHPVVPLQIEEEQNGLPQPLIISPEVAGHGEWVNSSVYVFEPESGLLSGTNYRVRVDAGLTDVNGEALQKSYAWNFSTRAPLIGNF
ncbi:MAG: Ig-like domain-containing protein, partial [Anaerolineales bacterium]|nr:Ig-like domain-containing protein [Anaerolineales bacterium]